MSATTKTESHDLAAVFADVYREAMIRGRSSYTIYVPEGGAEVTIKRLCLFAWNITEGTQASTDLELVDLQRYMDSISKTC